MQHLATFSSSFKYFIKINNINKLDKYFIFGTNIAVTIVNM